ncbi:anti-phage dCTP deaminase [Saccharospirillum sp.]|uniref:anti-phage dCTP deaminase n=1 Tax=Saccharospirillum sp. TaxID=2033801 RepID=UPI0034A02459
MDYYAKDCELVLGLVCPVGVNIDDVETRLLSLIKLFNYTPNLIHLSELARELDDEEELSFQSEVERLDHGMQKGTDLREKYNRGDFYSLLAINKISSQRQQEDGVSQPLGRTVHILRSLKHADEVDTLRQVYGSGFFLLGISASTESKKHYLRELKGVVSDGDLDRLIERDDKENNPLGQQTRNVFQLADAFATTDDTERLSKQLGRILNLLFSDPFAPPTEEEYAMFMAYAASLRSADLSRQVGAVIANEYGDIISTGANDVPKYGGGLYWPGEDDKRDYTDEYGYDSNEHEKNSILEDVAFAITESKEKSDAYDRVIKKLEKSKIMDLTEYGRAVHAEMEALLQASRNGVKVRGSTLYTTTFPCHNCAKHIVASGVKEVVYIEPYPKSFASKLHDDSIDTEGSRFNVDDRIVENDQGRVVFRPFVGVGPRRFIDLFSMKLSSGRKMKRKKDGYAVNWVRQDSELRVPMSPLSYMESEIAVNNELKLLVKKGRASDE